MPESLSYLAVLLAGIGIGIGIGTALALWTGHLARKKASREQREIAVRAEAVQRCAFSANDAAQDLLLAAHSVGSHNLEVIDIYRATRDQAVVAYYAALRGE